MDKKDVWKDQEKGKEEDFFMRKHREWLEKNKREKADLDRKKQRGEEPLSCPRCKKPLEKTPTRSLTILRCHTCGGGWLDRKDVKGLLESPE